MMLRICLLFLVLALTTTVAVEEEETTAKTQDAETCTNPPTVRVKFDLALVVWLSVPHDKTAAPHP